MPTEISAEKLGEAAKLVAKGVKRRVIAERLNVSRTTLTKYFPAPPKGGSKPYDVYKWAEALDEGMGYKHVGEVFNVSARTIRKYLPGRGWTPEQIREHAALMRRSHAL
jgi:uncharacterized protein YjcR